jgi:hypothetical protein
MESKLHACISQVKSWISMPLRVDLTQNAWTSGFILANSL